MNRIFCVGRNYAAHAQELGNAVPTEPVIFMKPITAIQYISDEHQQVMIPSHLGEVHYEAELVLRIGQNLKIDAITVGLDLTLREKQAQLKAKGLPWEAAKAFDGSAVLVRQWCPVTDYDEEDFYEFMLQLDGQQVQHGQTQQQIFKPQAVIDSIKSWTRLRPGDIIMTGTPEGVGPLKDGQKGQLQLQNAQGQLILDQSFETKA